jgi:hypothetical protein
MSVAPELAQLTESVLLVPRQQGPAGEPAHPEGYDPDGQPVPMTTGRLARRLRILAATPERWWSLVRFEPGRSEIISVEQSTGYRAWLVVLPPDHAGQACHCDVATMIAGEATEGTAASAVLRPGRLRVHGGRHLLRGQGTGYSISLHIQATQQART